MARLTLDLDAALASLTAQGLDIGTDSANDIEDAVVEWVHAEAEAQGIDTDEHADALFERGERLAARIMQG